MTSVLIIEDDTGLVELVKNILESNGFTVEAALDGEGGLARLSKKAFDVVLLDIMLPSVDGFEVCRRIRAGAKTKDIPVIAITALAVPGIPEKALKAGANDIALKPFEPAALIEKINRLLSALK